MNLILSFVHIYSQIVVNNPIIDLLIYYIRLDYSVGEAGSGILNMMKTLRKHGSKFDSSNRFDTNEPANRILYLFSTVPLQCLLFIFFIFLFFSLLLTSLQSRLVGVRLQKRNAVLIKVTLRHFFLEAPRDLKKPQFSRNVKKKKLYHGFPPLTNQATEAIYFLLVSVLINVTYVLDLF